MSLLVCGVCMVLTGYPVPCCTNVLCIPFDSCLSRVQPVFLRMRMLLLWITDHATDQVVMTGRQLHPLPAVLNVLLNICVVFLFPATSDQAPGKRKRTGNPHSSDSGRKGNTVFLVFPLFSTFQFCKTAGSPKDEVVCRRLF